MHHADKTHVINKELGQNNTLYSTAGDPLEKPQLMLKTDVTHAFSTSLSN